MNATENLCVEINASVLRGLIQHTDFHHLRHWDAWPINVAAQPTWRERRYSMDMEICLKPIGVIRTPFTSQSETPIQFSRSVACGAIEIFPEFEMGLDGLDELSHLILIYVFHKATGNHDLLVTPFLDDKPHGVFATRFYRRPNPIGFSVVRLLERSGLRLKIQSVDMLDGTPLLDIKPYIPDFDICEPDKLGWYANRAHP